uniref:Peroxisomal biogenesis factor 11 beta n=1 Tax=Zosterops lateralis melanops TaxID=1220523 RepID=A0A8D2PLR8_ZOSLA
MEAWVRFSAQSQARERLLRAAQYACTLAGAALSRSEDNSRILSRLQQLEAHLSLGRKREYRGRILIMVSLPIFPSIPDNFPLSHFCFSRYFLFALVVNLSRDVYEIRLLLERAETTKKRGKSPENNPHLQTESKIQRFQLHLQLQLRLLLRVLRENPPLFLDLLRNVCDLVIPLEKLGLCRSSPGVLGFCGFSSSVLSILTILHPWLKLKP